MKFAEGYAKFRGQRPVISFEVFPPRTEAAIENFRKVLPELIGLQPDFMTVTFGAMGSTREQTIDIAREIKEKHRLETACHLTCVGSTRQEIDALLDRIAACGIQNVVALRGDPPKGETQFRAVEGGYAHAIELVRHIRKRGGFGVAVAGYPEKHLEAPDLDTDMKRLKEKAAAGADLIITQLFYDNRDYYRFVEKARALGITQPIVPGLMPLLSGAQIRRVTEMCGAKIPEVLSRELEEAGHDDHKAQEIGIRQTVRQIQDLLAHGVPGIHFYVLNRASHMKRIFSELKT
ncbi:MAG: methylenetetrahydrofolate reductase [NAD(P)H] [Planctomycetes bacterium]|nr:methylenetetrahydrofolate reductase [NAD(P)H] [Planctomycetota bacterium]